MLLEDAGFVDVRRAAFGHSRLDGPPPGSNPERPPQNGPLASPPLRPHRFDAQIAGLADLDADSEPASLFVTRGRDAGAPYSLFVEASAPLQEPIGGSP